MIHSRYSHKQGSTKMDPVSSETGTARAIENDDFTSYRTYLLHEWLRTLAILASVLIPLFYILDFFILPGPLLPRFAWYRFISTVVVLGQYLLIRNTKPGPWTFLHAYLMTAIIGGTITLMTAHLGGFNSTYYAGLNLVVIAVNLLMPWQARHSAVNALATISFYLAFNLLTNHAFEWVKMTNNLFFLSATAVIVISISRLRYRLIKNEFGLMVKIKKARDALWGEMEIAKRIQTALMPNIRSLRGYEVAVKMIPAKEVGGDYFDILETSTGDRWITIGDVSGHGVESGLIMMMAQTSVLTEVTSRRESQPLDVLISVNAVLRENIHRLGSNHYMTMMLIRLEDDHLQLAGHHQDILLSRLPHSSPIAIPTQGTWIGISDQISTYSQSLCIPIAEGETLLLYTDGVTEGTNSDDEMYGQERLLTIFKAAAHLPVETALQKILDDVQTFQAKQADDITLILIRKNKHMGA